LWAVWLNGRNVRLSWKVSLANQALWLVFIVAFGAWGLLPLTVSLAAVFARHLTRPPKPAPAGGSSRQCARVPSGRRGPRPGVGGSTDVARQAAYKSAASDVLHRGEANLHRNPMARGQLSRSSRGRHAATPPHSTVFNPLSNEGEDS
jgi:hypothetical protein